MTPLGDFTQELADDVFDVGYPCKFAQIAVRDHTRIDAEIGIDLRSADLFVMIEERLSQ